MLFNFSKLIYYDYYNERNGQRQMEKVSPEKHPFRMDYFISNFGRVVSKNKANGTEFLRKCTVGTRGYLYIHLVRPDGKKGNCLVHKLVADAFDLYQPPGTTLVEHKDGNLNNNILSNLRYITEKDRYNKSLKKTHGIRKTSNAKLSIMQIKRLKLQLKRGKIRKAQLARMYNISDTQVNRIQSGENWGHIKV